jgi:hypothetical protein
MYTRPEDGAYKRYWLLNWIDDQGIRTLEDAERCLNDKVATADLQAKAHEAEDAGPPERDRSRSIVAGAAIDLSGTLDCPHRDCRKSKVEELFRRIWHYFDHVIIADPVGHGVTHHWSEQAEGVKAAILDTLHVVLHLREIGAETLVEFVQKPLAVHERGWLQRAEQAGLSPLINASKELQDRLVREAQVDLSRPENGHVSLRVEHPIFDHTEIVYLEQNEFGQLSNDAVRARAIERTVNRYLAYLTADIRAARSLGAPLGSAVSLHRRLLSQAWQRGSAVAFDIQLPVLDGIPVKTLIQIRLDEREYFERFRHRLTEAMRQRSSGDSDRDEYQIADEIRNDLLEPELRKIRDRLTASQRAFGRKAATGMIIGALTTTCGVMAGISPAVIYGAGIASAAALLGRATEKYIEEHRDISLEDMYFLWLVAKHGDRHEF